ncbi:uncharacterized protein BYT42DRAFT_555980 [Radiomyces spectabilis]|uniref:uncharacterized protein n=1 Tax=Radiomyces spectabilis TaxID=64574 RepID=UPI00222045A4|nr:uncharacterized protein BYT42DRAFT_555980 [Radiomyces spectabilis]KAI8391189.1 hypothetical protein BYT42DRAFT_555980 [Radiomyces spectabilis]
MSDSSAKINKDELASLKEAFQLYDHDKDGSITLEEFENILKSLGVASDEKHLKSLVQAIDKNKDDVIDFDEFVSAMDKLMPKDDEGQSQDENLRKTKSYPPTDNRHKSFNNQRMSYHEEDELMECFKAFDKNQDGQISRKELEEVLNKLGEKLSPDEIKNMMEDADTNKDGYIDFEEFKKIIPPMTSSPPAMD